MVERFGEDGLCGVFGEERVTDVVVENDVFEAVESFFFKKI